MILYHGSNVEIEAIDFSGETYQYFFGTERSLKYLRKL